jgi:hypothetical protein
LLEGGKGTAATRKLRRPIRECRVRWFDQALGDIKELWGMKQTEGFSRVRRCKVEVNIKERDGGVGKLVRWE